MKKTYTVSVESTQHNNNISNSPNIYKITIDEFPSDRDESTSNGNPDSAEACCNILYREYEHTVNRSDKLDNKVYIALTFCAFMFVSVLDLISNITKVEFPTASRELTLFVVYIVLCFITTGLFLHTLVELAKLLKPMEISRISADFYTRNELQQYAPFTIYTFTMSKYRESIDFSKDELENRFQIYYKCIEKLIVIVIGIFALYVLKQLL